VKSNIKTIATTCPRDCHDGCGVSVITRDGKFSTPSGKIEIASERAKKDGLPLVPTAGVDPAAGGEYRRLLSPADKYLMNSSYGNDQGILKKPGLATDTINPLDAGSRNIVDGDQVSLFNETGRLTLNAKVSDIVPAGAVLSTKGRWIMHETGKANVNILHIPVKTDMGESSSVHGTEVMLQKI